MKKLDIHTIGRLLEKFVRKSNIIELKIRRDIRQHKNGSWHENNLRMRLDREILQIDNSLGLPLQAQQNGAPQQTSGPIMIIRQGRFTHYEKVLG